MGWLVAAGILALLLGGFLLARLLMRNAVTSAVIGAKINSQPAEDAAAAQTQREAQDDASVVLRSSDDELRAEVERLRARGRSGK